MGVTITEKILAVHSGRDIVKPGELINCEIDTVMCHDVTTTPAIDMLEKNDITKVFDPERVVIMPDHFIPNKDIKSAEMVARIRRWAQAQGITNFYDIGRHGVCHALLPEQGYVTPGKTIVCGDSHTCTHGALGAFSTGIGSTDLAATLATGKLWFKVPESMLFVISGQLPDGVYAKDIILKIIGLIGVDGALYRAMEFCGEVIDELSVEGRMTICNMAIEAGAKTGVINPDAKTLEYVSSRSAASFTVYRSDSDAVYSRTMEVDVSGLEPVVALPHLPGNVKFAREVNDIPVDQAYLGSCTNGRIEDLRVAAQILKNRTVAHGTRMIVVPATTEIWKQANREGLLDIFMSAGATVSTPTCGACLGGYMGILAAGERCISSTNRNFVGRMGSPQSEVYLASPATVAASAITGKITDPRQYL
ncbi:MAG: 3-isopropylmalate dehydratase large subunit [Candidatus Marinimicrobia bacterium]|nr:3-isopropylmalate dehydratase large subunit [Candidatus Neomarinimicrobiota bacterium]MCK9483403.1 3-isopropylmalate dehydratase large subunit [Candidatus Neomarinimicrobiota bacterium]MCK9559305.1 3-isopropylmalate dehydratase large subunit [Candidatus Neomarinimicrobiota bacterium]MDD5061300.1 3-isopropylmalate dehydratase large subunit [Candidatus Neomarinimicrobiota bacterium]MDD5539542.1 3-isopropylmalate dehydratase large subunit [Candidatus Neomarinimicrobiota bacterium]